MQSLRAIILLTFATFASVLPAQEAAQNPVVTVDLERLVSETQIGQYLSFQMSEEAQSLQAELDAIEAELSAEEDDLIKKREILDLDEFRVLAKAFDEKAVRLRQEQQAKIQAITEESSRRRQDLLRSFVPVLSQVMRDRGATVLLDRRSVVLDDRASVDITDDAIMIIDQNTTETDAATDLETPAEPNVQE
ncbi:MAG: OmpH family outer membrane protein [Rhodobacteraceae bacterium]|jgi:Skp family chaperone for outer membrane proteins|nr:OmpH family outer membrane protein [Paracoccaceae bacterium]